ncbi:MAG: DNA-3-methyladenine glycosylase [Sandaracinaceae bacterium]|nr:DNA-3-methyladenine glycosylase [Sandaracinaceae bacterium]
MWGDLLPPEFYARDALVVARDLLGRVLVREDVAIRITESEAYRHPKDSANHCRAGRTKRNEAMWGKGGHAYVYVCYGIHPMLNVVSDTEGEGAAVLIRSGEALSGFQTIEKRRGKRRGKDWLAGPGKVAQALGLDPSFSGHPLYLPGGLELRSGEPAKEILVGPRVGIDYASPFDREAPYRFADASSQAVTHRHALRPLRRICLPLTPPNKVR